MVKSNETNQAEQSKNSFWESALLSKTAHQEIEKLASLGAHACCCLLAGRRSDWLLG